MQGNSLLEEYEGIKLFDEKLLENGESDIAQQCKVLKESINTMQQEYFSLNSEGKLTEIKKHAIEAEVKKLKKREKELQSEPNKPQAVGMFDTPNRAKEVYTQLKKLHGQFFEETRREKKHLLKNQIEELEWDLIETSLREQGKDDSLDDLKKLRALNIRPFFLWRLHFAEVFKEKSGFDIVIGNPPWEKVKPQDPEFFSRYDKDYRKLSKDEQKEFKEKLLKDKQIERDYEFFLESRKKIMESASEIYHLQGSSDLNLYKLFFEMSLAISSNIICWVIPGSITIDEGSFSLRKHILEENLLYELLGFSNKEKSFEWVDNNQKFVITALSKKKTSKKFKVLGWLTNAKNLDRLNHIDLDYDFYHNFDESNLTIFLTNNIKTPDLLNKMANNTNLMKLRNLPFHYWREFDATMDAKYFNDQSGERMVFSGKAMDQFDCMAKSWLEKHGRSSKWRKLGFPKDEKTFRTEYFSNTFLDRIKKHHEQEESNFRIIIQNVTGTVNNLRTVYAAPLHKRHLTNNSLHNLYIGNNDKELFFYLGILNSFVLDWQARIKVATNLNKFILESFIFPDFQKVDSELREDVSNIAFWLSDVCSDFDAVRPIFSKKDWKSRNNALAILNAKVAKIYSLDVTDFEFILSYFDLVDEEYRSRVLDTFKKFI